MVLRPARQKWWGAKKVRFRGVEVAQDSQRPHSPTLVWDCGLGGGLQKNWAQRKVGGVAGVESKVSAR